MKEAEHHCFCELAPLYALDLLDRSEQSWVEAKIVDDPDLAEELADYQIAVGLIPYGAKMMPMAVDLKDRLELDPVESIITDRNSSIDRLPSQTRFEHRATTREMFGLGATTRDLKSARHHRLN